MRSAGRRHVLVLILGLGACQLSPAGAPLGGSDAGAEVVVGGDVRSRGCPRPVLDPPVDLPSGSHAPLQGAWLAGRWVLASRAGRPPHAEALWSLDENGAIRDHLFLPWPETIIALAAADDRLGILVRTSGGAHLRLLDEKLTSVAAVVPLSGSELAWDGQWFIARDGHRLRFVDKNGQQARFSGEVSAAGPDGIAATLPNRLAAGDGWAVLVDQVRCAPLPGGLCSLHVRRYRDGLPEDPFTIPDIDLAGPAELPGGRYPKTLAIALGPASQSARMLALLFRPAVALFDADGPIVKIAGPLAGQGGLVAAGEAGAVVLWKTEKRAEPLHVSIVGNRQFRDLLIPVPAEPTSAFAVRGPDAIGIFFSAGVHRYVRMPCF